MHELSIAMCILDAAEAHAQRIGADRVCVIHVKLGPLAGVIKEALHAAFRLAREQTYCAGSDLVIEETQVAIHCPQCGTEQPTLSVQDLRCRKCGGIGEVISGRELDLTALEVESK